MRKSSRSPLRVGIAQMSLSDGLPMANLERALELMRSGPQSDLWVLPELWTSGYSYARWPEIAATEGPLALEEVSQFCRQARTHVAGSAIELDEQGQLVNRFRLFAPDGSCAMVYDKAHLFVPLLEDRYLKPGRTRTRVSLAGWNVSPSICFDLRFPEMYRLEAVSGAEVFLVVSEWPRSRAEALRGLAWARAVENQAFMILCNRTGPSEEGTEFGGGSMIVAPDGCILSEMDDAVGTISATLDPAAMELRVNFPVLTARAPGIDWEIDRASD
jgi:omega-amidase